MGSGPVHQPLRVDVGRDEGLTVEWDDGRVSRFGLEELRVSCPCAECRGRRDRDEIVWPTPASPRPLRIESAATVGQWGMSVVWNDGHSTGIYTWDGLRAWSDHRS